MWELEGGLKVGAFNLGGKTVSLEEWYWTTKGKNRKKIGTVIVKAV